MQIVSLWFAVTLMSVAGHFVVRESLAMIRTRISIPDISEDPELNEQWNKLVAHPDTGGMFVGHAERLVFFTAILARQWEIVGVWVAFKVAAKWESWSTIIKIPEELAHVQPLTFALGRRMWAAREYTTYVVGTALNGLMAVMGSGMVKFLNL